MTLAGEATPWSRGRLDARDRAQAVLFGRMYEDAEIEVAAFAGRRRIFCIASAGCTAMRLATEHDVVAVDVNAVQLDYARRRVAGAPMQRGTAERVLAFGRALLPLAGWRGRTLGEFLALEDPRAQIAFWRQRLDTRRFRAALDILFSPKLLRAVYASPLLESLPARFGRVMRARMERCFATHPNRTNPYARALLLGELAPAPVAANATRIEMVHADAAEYLERQPRARFDGFTFSNILDGATSQYRQRLSAATRRAAAPGAIAILRSFAEPAQPMPTNEASRDRSMLWGIVDVRAAESIF